MIMVGTGRTSQSDHDHQVPVAAVAGFWGQVRSGRGVREGAGEEKESELRSAT